MSSASICRSRIASPRSHVSPFITSSALSSARRSAIVPRKWSAAPRGDLEASGLTSTFARATANSSGANFNGCASNRAAFAASPTVDGRGPRRAQRHAAVRVLSELFAPPLSCVEHPRTRSRSEAAMTAYLPKRRGCRGSCNREADLSVCAPSVADSHPSGGHRRLGPRSERAPPAPQRAYPP